MRVSGTTFVAPPALRALLKNGGPPDPNPAAASELVTEI
jgi:hypothetical protein